jgi:hypothetical protein
MLLIALSIWASCKLSLRSSVVLTQVTASEAEKKPKRGHLTLLLDVPDQPSSIKQFEAVTGEQIILRLPGTLGQSKPARE